jgi:hypothetical protein
LLLPFVFTATISLDAERQGSPGPRDGANRRGLSLVRGLRCNR